MDRAASTHACRIRTNVAWQYYDADPVNTANGNYAYKQTDISIPVIGDLSFDFTRSYNSLDPGEKTKLGYGWQHSYMVELSEQTDQVTVIYGDGRQAIFTLDEGLYVAPAGNFDQLIKETDNTFRLKRKDNIVFAFDSLGRLVTLTDRNGHTISVQYSGNSLTSIGDSTAEHCSRLPIPMNSSHKFRMSLGERFLSDMMSMKTWKPLRTQKVKLPLLHMTQITAILTITDANTHTFLTNPVRPLWAC